MSNTTSTAPADPGTGPDYTSIVYAFTRDSSGLVTLYPDGSPMPSDATVITPIQWQLLAQFPNLVYDPTTQRLLVPHPVLDNVTFRALFTVTERGLAYAAALRNPVVLGGFLEAYALGTTDLSNPELEGWLNELVAEGVLDASRLPYIYAAIPPTIYSKPPPALSASGGTGGGTGTGGSSNSTVSGSGSTDGSGAPTSQTVPRSTVTNDDG